MMAQNEVQPFKNGEIFFLLFVDGFFLNSMCNLYFCNMGKDDDSINKVLNDCEIADESLLEQMGICRAVYEELMSIVGHLPTIDEVSTLMAMWRSQGGRQSMLTWLKGQFHSVVQRDYLDDGNETASSLYREPEVGECIAIARALAESDKVSRGTLVEPFAHTGDAIYMVGDVSALFANSEYGRRYLHIAENPIAMDDDEETAQYMQIILGSLESNGVLFGFRRIARGGLFRTLMAMVAPGRRGFDILTCREIRLDAFLFGEQGVRYLALLDEPHEDFFIQKTVEARLNCCFLGRVTRDRIVVDGVDFGRSAAYTTR